MTAIDRDTAVEEMLMMGLRLTKASTGSARTRRRPDGIVVWWSLARLLEGGFLTSARNAWRRPALAGSASMRCWRPS